MKINKKILISTLCTGVIGVSVPLTVSLSSVNNNQTNLNSVSGSQTNVVDNNNGLNQTTSKENYLNKDNNKLNNNNNVVNNNIVENKDVINKSEVESNEIELIQNFKTEIGSSSIKNYTNYSTDTDGYVIHGLVQNHSLRNKSVNEINKYLNINSFKKSLSLSAFKSVVETIGGLTNVNNKKGGMYSFNGDEHNFDQYNKVETDVKILKSQNNKAVYSIRVTPKVNYYWDTNTKDNKPIVYLITMGSYVYDENDNSEQELIANRKLFYVSDNFELLDLNKNVFNGNIIFHEGINDIKVIDETKMFQPLFDDSVKKVVLPSSLEELTITSTNDLSKLDFSNCVNLKKLTIMTKETLDLSLLDLSNVSDLETLEIDNTYLWASGYQYPGEINLNQLNFDNLKNLRNIFIRAWTRDLNMLNVNNLPNLESLTFDIWTNIRDIKTLFDTSNFTHLKKLSMSIGYSQLNELDLSNYTRLESLTIDVGGGYLDSYPIMTNNYNLKELSIITKRIGDSISNWTDFSKFNKLEKLSLITDYSDIDFKKINFPNLSNITDLRLGSKDYESYKIGFVNYESFFTKNNLPKLNNLKLTYGSYVNAPLLPLLSSEFSDLKSLDFISQFYSITSDASKLALENFKNLENLSIDNDGMYLDFSNITNRSFLNNLKSLTLTGGLGGLDNLFKNANDYMNLNTLKVHLSNWSSFDYLNSVKNSNVSKLELGDRLVLSNPHYPLDLSNFSSLKELSINYPENWGREIIKPRDTIITQLNLENTNLDLLDLRWALVENGDNNSLHINLNNATVKTALLSDTKDVGYSNACNTRKILNNNTSIEYLKYDNNDNSNFDISNINNLKWLISTNDILSTYDLTKLDKLENIDIRNNKNVLKVDITNLTNLNSISVKDSNPYVKVDTSTNKNLFYKYFDNDLVEWN